MPIWFKTSHKICFTSKTMCMKMLTVILSVSIGIRIHDIDSIFQNDRFYSFCATKYGQRQTEQNRNFRKELLRNKPS